MLNRRLLIAMLAAAASIAIASPALAQTATPKASTTKAAPKTSRSKAAPKAATPAGPLIDDDLSMGNPKSPVTVIEYASVACPYCAQFNNTVFADFKKKYIDTNQIRFVMREMLTHDATWAGTGFLVARCAGRDKYFDVVDALFHQRDAIEQSGDIKGGILKVAQSFGMTEDQFNACVSDQKAIDALNARVQAHMTTDGVSSTPTFVINGKVLMTQDMPMVADFDKAIADARSTQSKGRRAALTKRGAIR